MSFHKKLQESIVNSFDPVLLHIAEKFEIDYEDLKIVTTEILSVPKVCKHKFLSGKNKGKNCPKKPLTFIPHAL